MVGSAEEAIGYLDVPWPDITLGSEVLPHAIVLDINMPGMGLGKFMLKPPDFSDLVPVVQRLVGHEPPEGEMELPRRAVSGASPRLSGRRPFGVTPRIPRRLRPSLP